MNCFEDAILSDIIAVKLLDIVKNANLMPSANTNSAPLSEFLPPPALGILQRSGVLDQDFRYTKRFRKLYQERGHYFESRLGFILQSTLDVLTHGEHLIRDPEEFMGRASTFSFFNYAQGFEEGAKARAEVHKWCMYVSSLTQLEAPHLVRLLKRLLEDQSGSHVLEIGGNIGVFGQEFCKEIPNKSYSICDIPRVVDLGRERQSVDESRHPMRFLSQDMFSILSSNENLYWNTYVFKSVLHDWPLFRVEEILTSLIKKRDHSINVVIAERLPMTCDAISGRPHPIDAANFVFSPFYRTPMEYIDIFDRVGVDISCEIEELWIDMKWFVLAVNID